MQTLMFVFVALNEKASDAEVSVQLRDLLATLTGDTSMPVFEMMKSGAGLKARENGIGYYVSIINKRTELKDWFQLAHAFELSGTSMPVNSKELQSRYHKIGLHSNPYHQDQLNTAMKIFNAVHSRNLSVYCFQ